MASIDISSFANRRYLFFSSLKLNYPDLYKLADNRLREIVNKISNYNNDNNINQDFYLFMKDYLNKMHTIAERLRKNELLYINEGIKTLKDNN